MAFGALGGCGHQVLGWGENAVDDTAPTVTATTPVDGAADVAPNAAISATFSEPMAPETISSASFLLARGSEPVGGQVVYTGVTALFVPNETLSPATTYTVTITDAATDLSENPLDSDYVWTFTTGPFVDDTRPEVRATNPSGDATQVATNQRVVVTFSETMDPTTLQDGAFVVATAGANVAGTVEAAGVNATFTPSTPLLEQTVYTVTIATDVADLAGNTLAAPYTFSFTTGGVSDITAPSVTSTVPSSDETDVSPTQTIVANFDELMNPLTISTATFTVRAGDDVVAGTVSYEGVTASFRPSAPLANATAYTARVTTGVEDAAGNQMAANYVWSFTTTALGDLVAPQVTATTPSANAVEIAINTALTATFSEDMDVDSINTTTFSLFLGATPVPGAVTYVGRTATFQPTGALQQGERYTARISRDAADLAGNTLEADFTWSFTTGDLSDRTAPEVTATTPADEATNVSVNTALTATFSETMDASTINTATMVVFDGTTPVYGAVTYAGTTATFVPADDLEDSREYTATIRAAATDLAGNPMATDFTWTFTSGVAADTTAPTVVATNPANGALNAPFAGVLTATFSEPMQAATLSTVTFRVFLGATPVAGTVSYAGETATFNPTLPLAAFRTYTARISQSAEDLAGIPMAEDYIWSFTTGVVPDTTAPTVVATNPTRDALAVPFNTAVSATFSEAMAPLTLTSGAFVLRSEGAIIPSSVTYTGLVATLRPTAQLLPNQIYTATIGDTATDLAGNRLADRYSWSFTTGATPDTQAPRVTFTVPPDDATGVPLNRDITATFSEAMDPTTLNNESFSVQQLDVRVVGTVSYTGLTATFRANTPLLPLTTYAATINTDATDLAGNGLAASYVWNFRTGNTPDTTRPFVVSTLPEDEAIEVSLETAVTVIFNEPMDPLSLNDATFFVTDGLVEIGGTISVVGATAIFLPEMPLDPDTTYTATITAAATDLAGNPLLEDTIWTFSTGLLPDLDPPMVILTSPEDLDTDVPLDVAINATFSEPMDPLTINNLHFEVRDGDGLLVDGTVVYDLLTDIATYLPDSDLLPGTTYEATITVDVTDLAGNHMEDEYTWEFSTGALASGLQPIDLGSLSTFVAVAGAGLTNSNSGGITTLNGDVGLSPVATCLGDGSPCTLVNPVINGSRYFNDPEGIAAQAKTDLVAAYVDGMSRPPGETVNDITGRVLPPGVYTSASTMSIAVGGTVTLDGQGDANAVWIFQIGSSLTVNNNAQILTINGASAKNVFWVAFASSTLGTDVQFQGSVLAGASNSVGVRSTVIGRLLCTTGQITLLSNTITLPPL